jgi:hypothetical protein
MAYRQDCQSRYITFHGTYLDRYFSLANLFFDDFDDALDGRFKEFCDLRTTRHQSSVRLASTSELLPVDFDTARSDIELGIILSATETDEVWLG